MDTPIRRAAMMMASNTVAKRYTELNEARVNEVLGQPKVVVGGTVIFQDPPAGTPIARGGGVTLTIARTRDFPMNIIEGAHLEYDKYKIGEVFDELTKTNPEPVLKIFEDVDEYEQLTEVQRQQVDAALGKLGIPGSKAGYKGAQGALALGGVG